MKLSLSLNRKPQKPGNLHVLTTIYYYTSIHSKTEKSYNLRINKYKNIFRIKSGRNIRIFSLGWKLSTFKLSKEKNVGEIPEGRPTYMQCTMKKKKRRLIAKYKDDTNSN